MVDQVKSAVRILGIIGLLFAGFLMVGCEQEGPMEQAGEEIDESIDAAGDQMEEAADEVEDSVDEAEDEIDDVG